MPQTKQTMSFSSIFNSFLTPRKNKFAAVLLMICFSLPAQADRVNNGGELSEANVAIALSLFPDFLESCLRQPTCLPRPADRQFLQKLLTSYPAEVGGGESNYEFLSGARNPSVFGPQADALYWATEPRVGAKIFLNADLFPDQIDGKPSVISVRKAFRIWFLALASHHSMGTPLYHEQLALEIVKLNPEVGNLGPEAIPSMNIGGQGFNQFPQKQITYRHERPLSAESWITNFWQHFDVYLQACLQDEDCLRLEADRQLIREILENWQIEVRTPDLIRFESGTSRPDLFVIDGVVKTAVTGLQRGEPIYFNRDRIYSFLSEFNWLAPIKAEAMLALLVHEAGHHLGISDHAKLDVLGFRLGQYFQRRQSFLMFEEDYDLGLVHTTSVFYAQIIQPLLSVNGPDANTKVFLSDEVRFLDFTPTLERIMSCPAHLERKGFQVRQAFWTGYFYSALRSSPLPENVDDAYVFRIEATLLCQLSNGRQVPFFWEKLIRLAYSRDSQARGTHTYLGIWDSAM
jgi:hypothetical protein